MLNTKYQAWLSRLGSVAQQGLLFTDTPNTLQSEYYKGDCLEVEESQGSSWPYDREILYETTTTIHTYWGYSSLVQLEPAWQRYIACRKAKPLVLTE